MFYMYGGKIYGPRSENGALVYDEVVVRTGENGAPRIERTGESSSELPAGALPVTMTEVLARGLMMDAQPQERRPQRQNRGGEAECT